MDGTLRTRIVLLNYGAAPWPEEGFVGITCQVEHQAEPVVLDVPVALATQFLLRAGRPFEADLIACQDTMGRLLSGVVRACRRSRRPAASPIGLP